MNINLVNKLKTVAPSYYYSIHSAIRYCNVESFAKFWEGYISGGLFALLNVGALTAKECETLEKYYRDGAVAIWKTRGVTGR